MLIPDILVKQLSLIYQKKIIFKDINLYFHAKKWVCLLGSSGIGKSSLLRILAGLLQIDNGSIECSDQKSLQNRLSYMAQHDGLLPWLSVINNVLLNDRLRANKITLQRKQQAMQLLDQVGLKNNQHSMPNQLSGGMRQRVSLARTLLDNQPIILMDEPFSALDTIMRLKLQTLAAKLLIKKTVIMVTHDPLEALRLADEIYIMHDQPVKFTKAIVPIGRRPRNINNDNLLKQQAKLLNLLEQKII